MSLESTEPLTNGCSIMEGLKTNKILKSLVVPDNDPLKIKLKISKKEIEDPSSSINKEIQNELKTMKSYQNSPGKCIIKNCEDSQKLDNSSVESRQKTSSCIEPKMKLRSTKETDLNVEQSKEENDEVSEEKKRKRELWSDKGIKNLKKRRKTLKLNCQENFNKGENDLIKKNCKNEESIEAEKSMESIEDSITVNKESFCWTCHKDGSVVKCDTCPRVFHLKCVSLSKDPSKNWICPECSLVLHAEKMSTRSEAMKSLSLDQLCTLLNFAIGRMKNVPESQAFWKPVDPKEVPFYDKYITNPMDLNLLERNMKAKMYGSPQAFLADTKWLLHNSIIFNSTQSPLTSTARFLVKICRQEMAEIENCPDCYLNAHTKENWFIEVCRKPHILIWARLKGFPFWPAKAMSTNLKTQQVDARFFGAHDKAWVPVKECYLYSKSSPQLFSKKRADLDDAFLEAEGYIKKIRQKYGTFCYAPDKTPFMPEMYDKQLQSLIPNYKEEKLFKKKRKGELLLGENGLDEKPYSSGKKNLDHSASLRCKVKKSTSYEKNKVDGDICLINDEYVSEEKVLNDVRFSPEDEIARRLEMYDTHKKSEGEAAEENLTDLDEDGSLPIPEHGYSRRLDNINKVVPSLDSNLEMNEVSEFSEKEKSKELSDNDKLKSKSETEIKENLFVSDSSTSKPIEEGLDAVDLQKINNNEQCEVSSTSVDLKVVENDENNESVDQIESGLSLTTVKNCENTSERFPQIENNLPSKEVSDVDLVKKVDERLPKSFVNLTSDQKLKILNEAKLLASIDEMTALEKQKVLNELGLDASKIDIRQLAQENREILEVLNKKGQNKSIDFEEVNIKKEEELSISKEDNGKAIFEESALPVSPKLGSIKVKDFRTLSGNKNNSPSNNKNSSETALKISDVQSLQDFTSLDSKSKSFDNTIQTKKLILEPVVELIKLDSQNNKPVEKLNRKLRLSDEVSLLMVDGIKKTSTNVSRAKSEAKKLIKKNVKSRSKRVIESQSKGSSDRYSKLSCTNINVISVDTENSTAQKKLLKSLRLEEKKTDESGRKTVLITTKEKGIKNSDLKSANELTPKKQVKEVTIEAVKDGSKVTDQVRDGNSLPQKNLTVVANSHVIVTNNRSALISNQNSQPNLALAQNNLGQLSLVHLSNLTSGIQTNFVNLTNETIGFNNSIGTLYASPGFNSDYPVSSGTGSVIFTPTLTTSLQTGAGNGGTKTNKSCNDPLKLPGSRVDSTKTSGISVKSPATLGLISPQPNRLPPLMAIPGEGISLPGDVGSVSAELEKHSLKMAEYMKATIEDILRELSNQGSLEARYKLLILEMEKLQWKHQQEITELKHHSERTMLELRNTLELDKQKSLEDLKTQLESHYQKVISDTKRKQWCANCGKEALFYCCWNTSYCDYPCQQQHWPGHMNTCAQLGNNVSIASSSQLQSVCMSVTHN